MNYLIIFFRTVFFYFFIILIYRIMGKREVGQLGIIDLIVSILMAELAMISIEGYDKSIFYSILPIITLTILQTILAYFSIKKPKLRNFLDGNPSIIIKEGHINYKEMLKQRYSLDDLLVQIRDKGFKSLEEVEYAILENNGSLSVFGYANKNKYLPLPIILDGKVQKDTLKYLDKDEEWIDNILTKKDVKLENIFYAFYKDKNIFIIKQSDLI